MARITFALAFISVALMGCSKPADAPAQVATNARQQAVPDDTDDMQNGKESGLQLRTDFGTGCQYLMVAPSSALTPRLGEDGKPLCNPNLKRKPR
jgi:hypothetical protein